MYTKPTLVFPQETECPGTKVMGYVTLQDLCHRNALVQALTTSLKS